MGYSVDHNHHQQEELLSTTSRSTEERLYGAGKHSIFMQRGVTVGMQLFL